MARAFAVLRGLAGAPVVLLALLAAAAPAVAQEGVAVERIVFEGNKRYSTENLKYSMRTKEGRPLDRELLARDVSMLRSFFDEISMTEEAVPGGGVRLTFAVRENPLVSRVEFLGADAIPEADLRALVETRTGYPLALFKLENDVRVLERKYRDAGHHFVEVRPEVLDEEGARRVIFRVIEGPEVEVDDVVFEGNDSIPAGRLRAVMALRPSRILSPTPYVERRLEEDRVALAKHYRDEGFLEARVWVKGVDFGEGREDATIHVAVEEGGPWTLGTVSVTGGDAIPDRARVVAAADRLVPGQRWLRKDLDRVLKDMEDEIRRQGFSDGRIQVEPVPRAEGRVQDVRFVVLEGRRSTVRFIDVAGNVLTQDRVILREFSVAPGEPLDSSAIAKSVRRVLDTQYFTSAIPVYRDTDDPSKKDVEIRVEENPRTSQLRVGFGLSSDTGLFGTLSVTFRNFDIADLPERLSDFGDGRAFKGAGQTLQLVLQPGTDVSTYRLGFTEPWFLDMPVLAGFDVYAYESTLYSYDEDRTGGSLQAERRWLVPGEDLDDMFNAGIRPRLEYVRISNIRPEAPPNAWYIEGGNTVHSATLDLLWRRIDQEYATERGFRLSVGSEYAGDVLGGDFDFWKNTAEAVRVWTLWRDADERAWTVKLRAGGGVAMTLGDQDVPLVERLFAGGASGIGSVRGFAYGGLGPHGRGNPYTDPGKVQRSIENNDGEPMGGDAMAVASAEVGFPIFSDVLRGALFLDAGNCGFSTGDLLHDWRSSAGFGILIKVPFFGAVPLRFDFAWTLRRVPGDDTQILSFEFSKFF